MSRENLERFCRSVLESLEIQAHLKHISDREEFIEKVLKLGTDAGFDFSREDIEQKMRENRRLWIERWI